MREAKVWVEIGFENLGFKQLYVNYPTFTLPHFTFSQDLLTTKSDLDSYVQIVVVPGLVPLFETEQ